MNDFFSAEEEYIYNIGKYIVVGFKNLFGNIFFTQWNSPLLSLLL